MTANIRIRMYRTGFGDCFLLSFGTARSARHVLIDFGVHAQGDIGTMASIMDHLESETGRKLDLLVVTHAHRDHISGFGQFADRFAQFEIGEIWMPWTDNPRDKDATGLERKHLALYDRLEKHLRVALAARPKDAVNSAALHAISNMKSIERTRSELSHAFGTGARVRYLGAGVSFGKAAGIPGLSAEILGPPRDKRFFSRMDPLEGQHFLSTPGETNGGLHPFPGFEIRPGDPEFEEIVKDRQPLVPPGELPALQERGMAPVGRLTLALDSVRNNTSLVILFRYQGKTLLFPGDAQWDSWQSWINTDNARQLLGELDFLKVAHHGSESATPVSVVKSLKSAGLVAMVPTQVKPFPTIPCKPLLDELRKHCEGQVVVRSDWIDVKDAPPGPRPRPGLPRGFELGEVWIDYNL
jgi:hypothetical protein